MARSSVYDDPFRGAGAEVWWAGWRSDTRQLQRHGWVFSVEDHDFGHEVRMFLRHERNGWTGYARAQRHQFRTAFERDFMQQPLPAFQVQAMTAPDQMVAVDTGPLEDFRRVDMEDRFIEPRQLKRRPVAGIFKPWIPEAQELIVEPATVAELLDKIKAMQAPELAAVRERNRLREAREGRPVAGERVVAQVLTLAA